MKRKRKQRTEGGLKGREGDRGKVKMEEQKGEEESESWAVQ